MHLQPWILNVGRACVIGFLCGAAVAGDRRSEPLGRGLAGLRTEQGVFLSWRLLASDAEEVAFNVYRSGGNGEPAVRVNEVPITQSTTYVDSDADAEAGWSWFVRPVNGSRELETSAPFHLDPDSATPYLSIPLRTPEGYTPNDGAVGDLNGDGEYDLVLKQEMRPRDNSQRGVAPGTTKLEGYTLRGDFLWRIDLGRNIREGAHYTPFIVFDLDGDGISEIAVRTAEGSVDGNGNAIGDVNADGRTNYVNPRTGYILEGPEFISIFNGHTGEEMARADYIARGQVTDWGDDYGNRVDRFLMGVAYLDGKRPSLILCRGYYALTKLEAWNWREGQLTKVWTFSSSDPGHAGYGGQGNHNLSIGDVDGDGRDEIIYGACAIDDDGQGLYTTGLGHGDAIHLSDIDPDRPGLELFDIHEKARHPHGVELRDAGTGEIIWSKPSPDVGRGVAFDVDPRHRGYEVWASGRGVNGLWNAQGEMISETKPSSCNMGVWWDGDRLRELLSGTRIDKWNFVEGETRNLLDARDLDCASNNGSKANPVFAGDILGDWREEVIWRTRDNRELRVFMSTLPTDERMTTLMHDPVYRISAALQNVGYNQPAQPGFYLGME